MMASSKDTPTLGYQPFFDPKLTRLTHILSFASLLFSLSLSPLSLSLVIEEDGVRVSVGAVCV